MIESRYSATLLSIALVLLVASGTGSYLGYRHNITDFQFLRLYHYQLAKLQSDGVPGIVFVGDSSLGNAIDVEHWRSQSGVAAVNLALTGSFGLVGSKNMIKRVLAVKRPKLVVVMQTADLLSRGDESLANLLTAPEGELRWTEMSLRDLAGAYFTHDSIGRVLSGLWIKIKGGNDNTVIVNDYIQQSEGSSRGKATNFGAATRKLPATAINPDMVTHLQQIAALCQREKLMCVYAHGPLAAPLCGEYAPFITQANKIIQNAGLTLVPSTPLCLPGEKIGDADDHVAPLFKHESTQYYLGQIRAYLQ